MAKKTVQAVRQAELDAEKMEKEALTKKEEIIAQAHLTAKTLMTSMTKEAMSKAEQALNATKLQTNEIMETSIQKAQNEVLILEEMLKSKEKSAIDLILSNVI